MFRRSHSPLKTSFCFFCPSWIIMGLFLSCLAAAVVSERRGGSWIGVQFQPVVVVGGWRSSGQFRVCPAMRLQVAGIARWHGSQNEYQSQRWRLWSHAAAYGRRRRREQEKLVNIIMVCVYDFVVRSSIIGCVVALVVCWFPHNHHHLNTWWRPRRRSWGLTSSVLIQSRP